VLIVTVTLNTSVDRTVAVPGFAIGTHLKGTLASCQPAGKGVNVSRGLAGLGVPSVVAGFVGQREATWFRDSFADLPATVALTPVDSSTRTCTTLLDPTSGTDTHVREAGPTVGPHHVAALTAQLAEWASPDTRFVFCGSLPPGVTRGDLADLMGACTARGAQVVADLNGAQLGTAVAARPLLIKPNVDELAELLGTDLAGASEDKLVAAARTLCDRVGTVVLTRGRDGALAVTPSAAWAARVDVADVRNTVGCGDAALAGILWGLWLGEPIERCLARAVACGGASAQAEAAGQIRPQDVAALLERTTVRVLA